MNWHFSQLMANPLSSAAAYTHEAGLDAYRQLGGNSLYLHGEGGEIHSREATGRWLRNRGLRDDFFICTQVGHEDWDEVHECSINRFTAPAIKEDVSRDLGLIGTNRIDLIGLSDSPQAPIEPVIDAVAEEISAGRVCDYGFCYWSAARIEEAIRYAKVTGVKMPSAVFTTELSLLRATGSLWPEYPPFSGELELVVREHALIVFAHVNDMNLGQCLFGDADAMSKFRSHWVTRWNHPDNPPIVERVQVLAAQGGLTTRAVNIAWVLQRTFSVVGIVGLPALIGPSAADYVSATRICWTKGERLDLRQETAAK